MAQNQQEIAGGEEKYPRYRWVMIGLLLITPVVGILFIGGIGILLPAMREDLGFGVAEAGVLGSLGNVPMAILSIPASLLLVRFSPKWVYFISLVFAAVAGFFVGQAPAFIFLAVAYSFIGVAMTMRQVPDTLLRLQWIAKKEFATIMGLTQGMMAMGQGLSAMAVPFLLIVLESWRNLFTVYSIVILLMSLIWIVFARAHVTSAYQEGMSSLAGRAPLRSVLKRKEFLMLGIVFFGGPLAYMTTFLFLPTYLLEERGIALTTAGFIVGLMPIGGVCATFSVGFISDRIGLRKPFIWPAGLILPLLYFVLLSPIPAWALPVLTFVVGYVAWAPDPMIRTIPFELPGVKPSEVAVGQSLIFTIPMVGGIIAAPAVGYLAEMLGSLGTALHILYVFPLTFCLAGFLLPETGPKARSKERGKRKQQGNYDTNDR